jgi:predicted nucleic acid-binding Zn ribbon protein
VRRKFTAPAIVFKGSGFYVTDSRSKNSAAAPPGKKEGSDSAAKTEKAETTA